MVNPIQGILEHMKNGRAVTGGSGIVIGRAVSGGLSAKELNVDAFLFSSFRLWTHFKMGMVHDCANGCKCIFAYVSRDYVEN